MPTVPQQSGQWQVAGQDAPVASPAAPPASSWAVAGADTPLTPSAPPPAAPQAAATPSNPLTDNPNSEGVYQMQGPKGSIGVPYSKVQDAKNQGYALQGEPKGVWDRPTGDALRYGRDQSWDPAVVQGYKDLSGINEAKQIGNAMVVEPGKKIYQGLGEMAPAMHAGLDPHAMHDLTPEQIEANNRLANRGTAHYVQGVGTYALELDAPALLEVGVTATGATGAGAAEVTASRLAMAKIAAYAAGGEAASQVSGAAADKLQLSPETKELIQSLAFFTPTLLGVGLGKVGFKGAMGVGPDGQPVAGFSTPGGTTVGVRGVDGGVEAGIHRPGDPFPTTVRVGRQPTEPAPPPPPPDPAKISAAEEQSSTAQAMVQAQQLETAATNVAQGKPPVPPPPGPPPPPGLENGVLTQKVVSDVASGIKAAPPQMQAQLQLEAHGKLADWMLKTGKFIGPDGKLQIADTPQKAASLAQQVLNNEADRHQQAADDAAKQQQEAQAAQQKQAAAQAKEAAKQQKEAQKVAETPNENGLTPAEVQQARAKTIIESSDSPEQASANIMRSLRVTRDVAQGLIAQHQQQQALQGGTDVGSGAEPTKEESRATVDAQMAALQRGDIKVVMLPEGSNYMPQVPPGMKMMSVNGDMPGAGKYIYNPTQLRAATIKEAAKAGTHGDLLGHIQSKEELQDGQPTVVVQAHTPEGVPVQDSQVHADAALIQAQAEALKERHPDADISVKTPEQVLQERIAATDGGGDGGEAGGWEVAGEDEAEIKPQQMAIRSDEWNELQETAKPTPYGWKIEPHEAGPLLIHPEGHEVLFFQHDAEPQLGMDAAMHYASENPTDSKIGESRNTEPTERAMEGGRGEGSRGEPSEQTAGGGKESTPAVSRIAGHEGRETSVLMPDNTKMEGRYRLVEHSDLTTSHSGIHFGPNANYPRGVQERNYDTDKEAQARVIKNAAEYEPGYTINGNPDAVNGPPIVTPDGVVLGGNGRTMSLGRLYGQGGGDTYKNALSADAAHYGFTPEQVASLKEPVLVREVEKPGTTDEMNRVGSLMNKSKTGAMTPFARAVSAGKKIQRDTLTKIGDMVAEAGTKEEPATLNEVMASPRDARSLLKMLEEDGAITAEEHPNLVDTSKGGLSAEGKTFVKRAIMGVILDEARLMEITPDSVIQRLEASLGGLAIIAGRDDSWNVLPVIRAAAGIHAFVAKSDISLDDYFNQGSMFRGPDNPVVNAMAKMLAEGAKTVRDAFTVFAADANMDVPGQGTFLMESPAPDDAFNNAFGTKLSADDFYDGLMAAAAEDPYEKQAEQEGTFRRQRTRGLSTRQPRDESQRSPAKAASGSPAKAEPRPTRGDAVPSYKPGNRVTVTDRDGVERTGTVAHSNELVTRVKTDKGEVTVATSSVKPASEEVAKPAGEEQTGTNGNPSQPAATTEPAAREADGRREVASPRSSDREPVDEVAPGLFEAAPSGREAEGAGEANSPAVRGGAATVRSEGAGSGSGARSDSGLDHSPAGPIAEEGDKLRADVQKPNTGWFSHPATWSPPAGTMGKLDGNLEALRVLRDLQKSERLPTPEEQAKLADFVGWGALQHVFAPRNAPGGTVPRWTAANKELVGLLSPDEMAAASRSTQNAHYTSPELVRYVWDVMKQLGFKGGNVLEPSMGSGNFFGMMPKAIRNNVTAVGNELDPVTAGIAKLLYPGATVFNKDFVQLILPDNSVDLAVSNVPFGVKVYDPKVPKLNAQIHDYFFVKSLDKVKPGGVVAFITSTGTMDKVDSSIRDLMASKADLLGAVRLPSGAFAKNAGTDVTTDLILLQKRALGAEPGGQPWSKTVNMRVSGRERGAEMVDVPVNEYFHANPDMMLGKPGISTMYGRDGGFALYPDEDQKIGDLLDRAKANLPKGIMNPDAQPVGVDQASTNAAVAKGEVVEGQFLLDDKGNLKQVVDGKLVDPAVATNPDGSKIMTKLLRLKDMVGLRDKMNPLLSEMLTAADDDASNAKIARMRDALKRDYLHFVRRFGYLNSYGNRIFEDDPHYPRLLALEEWDKAKKVGTPAEILSKRTLYPRQELTMVSSDPREALYQVLAERGYPDVDMLARLQGGADPKKVAAKLLDANLIYRDPESGQYQMRDKYLSGYVRDKLDLARKAVEQGLKEYQPNVEALEKVQPADIPIKEIEVKLGATWIPLDAFPDFIRDVLKVQSPGKVTYTAGVWRVSALPRTAEVASEYGTDRVKADEILAAALNQKEVTITDKDDDGKQVLNKEATLVARAKQEQLRKAFNDWASSSPKWADKLAKTYNYAFNNQVLPDYDGSHLTFPGKSSDITLGKHQVDAVWRLIQDGRGLLAHVVGAGKTFEMIATVMEGRRMGTFKKPLIAVPNHLVGQWQQDFARLYPGSRVLASNKKELGARERQRLMVQIATGDYDAIIMPHSHFNQMDISPERQLKTMRAMEGELIETISSMQANKEDKRTVKQMEKSLENLRTRMAKLADLKADKAINFDDTGVDNLLVDEAHAYKNLSFYTKMQRVAGLSQGDAKRALRLKAKTEYLQDVHGGRGVVFATGTPIQNTMAEAYTMTKYVAPDVLLKAGIKFFDDWAANFGSVRAINEISADGQSFKVRSKFSRFTNVPELMQMFRSFADIKTAKMLGLPTPKLIGGKPNAHYIDPSPELQQYVESLVRRAQNLPADPRQDNMLKIVSDGRKAALDMRLVDPKAPDDPDSKINQVVGAVLQNWKEGKFAIDAGGKKQSTTQLVFLDQYRALEEVNTEAKDGTPVTVERERLNLYKDMRAKWVKAGIPTEQIAIIGDYDTDAKKSKLFDAVNAGEMRIVMGSTEKMGAGTNVQRLLKFLHHVDLPWRPGDLAQRTGRIERRGNLNDEVGVDYWLTQRSFDTYMLQALESKAHFIEQLMSGNFHGRTMVDLDSSVSMNLQDMKVATSGNPDIKLKYDLDQERDQLETLKSSHDKQRRDNLYNASSARSAAVRTDATADAAEKALERYKAVKGPRGEGFHATYEGKSYDDRKAFGEYLDNSGLPQGNFHMEINGVNLAVDAYSNTGEPKFDYTLEFSNEFFTPPEPNMPSLLRSVESRLRNLSNDVITYRDSAEALRTKAAKLDELAKTPFRDEDKLAEVEQKIEAVEKRLGLREPDHDEQPAQLEADAGDDDLAEGDEDEAEKPAVRKGGQQLRASVFGADLAAEGAVKLAKWFAETGKTFYDKSVAPNLTKAGSGASDIAKSAVSVLAPRAFANLDGLDMMMKLKGELEARMTFLEYAMKDIKSMFAKMPEEGRLNFIDWQKGFGGDIPAELQKVGKIYREMDTALHHAVVDSQISTMDATVQRFWKNLDPAAKADYWLKIEAGEDIARKDDEEAAKSGNADAARRLKLQDIADSTLAFRQDHFRAQWATLPSPEGMLGMGVTKSPRPVGSRRPLAGDKGFTKKASGKSVRELIARGGVLATSNPQELFELQQMSAMRYITANEMKSEARAIGLRKFVQRGETPPEGWVEGSDPGDKPSFMARSGEGFIRSGSWYYEPSLGRLIRNYQSPDWIRSHALGKGLMAFKEATTSAELSLSPFHAVNMTARAMGSQIGAGVKQSWNSGVRGANLQQVLKGAGLAASFPAAPVQYVRSASKAISELKEFLKQPGATQYVRSFGNQSQGLQDLYDYFIGGGTLDMPRGYRTDSVQAFREALTQHNWIAAGLRSPFAASAAIMKPLFHYYIPRLKLGLYRQLWHQALSDNADDLATGKVSRAELSRKVVDSVENRFGELNWSNLFWNNTFKTAAQFTFRSSTWKIGEWRSAGSALGPEMKGAFADPFKAMYEDAKAGQKQRPGADYVPKMGDNQAYLIGMAIFAAIVGTVASKLFSGKYPWEYLDEDEKRGHSVPGALLLETLKPRVGHNDPYTGLPVRADIPTGFRDYEHAARDPLGYGKSSLTGELSKAIDSTRNRDFFGNYVYDPAASPYQKMAQLFSYNVPKPITVENYMESRGGDKTNFYLGLAGTNRASNDYDLTPAETKLREIKRAAHTPETPQQVADFQDRDANPEKMTPKEIHNRIREGRMDYIRKLADSGSISYGDLRSVYNTLASPSEKKELKPILEKKKASLLARDPAKYRREEAAAD